MKALAKTLREELGKQFVLDSPEELAVYDCDACTLIKKGPELVALPKTPEEVATVVNACNRAGVAYTARGAGTGLSGGALPLEGGVLIGLNRMNQILEIDAGNRTATVEVGVINASLNQQLKPYHLFYAPDPSSMAACTIGGNIAENAGGIHCIQYGVTTDHVLALQLVLPNGELTWVGSKNKKSNGPNLTGLIVGSEGTLGVITQAIVGLLPVPPKIKVYLAAFAEERHAGAAVSAIIKSGLKAVAVEFLDAFTLNAVNEAFNVGFPHDAQAVLLIELAGADWEVENDEARLRTILEEQQMTQLRVGETEAERLALWKSRKGTVAAYGRYMPAFYLHDCVIPRSQLVPVLEKIRNVAKDYDVLIGNVFHAGDGNLHPHIFFDPADKAMLQRALNAGEVILRHCLSIGGTLSGEHGIGIEKSHFMKLQFTEESLEKMHQLKSVFDPEHRCNPLKILPVRAGCAETRQGHTPQLLAQDGLWI
ncbi:MAG: FAD-linked oxidase C-terminal domain-containing protein [Cyanobacteria bacterium P01_H01_bin.74]